MHPTAILVFQQPRGTGELGKAGRIASARFFSGREWSIVVVAGLAITVAIATGYERSLGAGRDTEHARAMALAMLIFFNCAVVAALSRLSSRVAVLATLAAAGSALVLVQVAPIADLLHLAPLHFDDWLLAAGGGVAVGALAALIPAFQPTISGAMPRPTTDGDVTER
jgi:Ca2+-transporting ATPase